MSQQLNGSVNINIPDSRVAAPAYQSGANAAANALVNYSETEDIATMKAALKAFDAFTYSDAQLDILSANDILFAWRACRGNQASISNYHPAQTARTS